jgi:uncharacterized protein (UPF0303 family)
MTTDTTAPAPSLAQDIAKIAEQEAHLQFPRFDKADAWALGAALKTLCEQRGQAVTIEIRLGRETVFFYAMEGTTANNADWARRKRNTTELVEKSSYAVGLELKRDGKTQQSESGLPMRDFASHGGSFPIRVLGVGCVGVVTVSGLPQREDHKVVVQAVAAQLGVPSESLLSGF